MQVKWPGKKQTHKNNSLTCLNYIARHYDITAAYFSFISSGMKNKRFFFLLHTEVDAQGTFTRASFIAIAFTENTGTFITYIISMTRSELLYFY